MQKCDDASLVAAIRQLGNQGAAKLFEMDIRNVYRRRREIEGRYGVVIDPPSVAVKSIARQHPQRVELQIENGIVLVGSDGHYWPGEPTTAHKAFVKFCRDLKPSVVIMNGDAFDGASISRHPPIGWEDNPTVKQEIEAVQERLGEIEAAAGHARKIWPLGNHDARFETRLASVAPEYAKVHGVHLSDHFPLWEGCWSCWINGSVVVKHRYKGGIHATHNNTVTAGLTMITGHLHSLKVTPFTDYNGDRFGVDTGTLADPNGRQFVDYSEDSPKNHRSGFIVLTFRDGKLMWPEIVNVMGDGLVGFRGEIIEVATCESTNQSDRRAAGATRARSVNATSRTRANSKTNRIGRVSRQSNAGRAKRTA